MSKDHRTRSIVEEALARNNGILRLEPAWVARDSMMPGRRLGLCARADGCEAGPEEPACGTGTVSRLEAKPHPP